MDVHLRRFFVHYALLAAALLLLSGCTPQSTHGASGYFKGRALELAVASEQGDAETITHLIKDEGVDPDKIFARDAGIPLVAWPLRAKNLDGLRALLDNGADPNARAYKVVDGRRLGYNNAMVYAAKLDDPRYLQLLLQHGGDPNTRNSAGETLLFQAFIAGNQWENVKLLIENGANINESNRGTADTVLSWYTTRGGFEHAYWLLEHGADPTVLLKSSVGAPDRMLIAEHIFWGITTPDLLPWQRKCQQWLVTRDIPRPPMPKGIRDKREAFGFPTKEEDIPLP
ncbi:MULTISPECIES: ankyrin repeat domain-containing protein [Stenotrophomonas]|uniref:Ankyrin repeat domain-containing protein n=1 Tax=Stenotrophomonas lactitubi TaxID=2045214 RepID=A0AAW4GEU6_9GAMM|nr:MULTISPECIES: ankyrin repeat domain-containing protein [Stenotrophomonas]MBM9912969.1 ankyrin repeat domain-containing protein [Stenotrophomonas lactitubi]MBM9922478.1 ankyrin repeat domain-containing protein [Stenotrophomonas lactitubi]MBM9937503.1 ankyrin repeat domain-containing protein [Stenotrophomonas lactitubi]